MGFQFQFQVSTSNLYSPYSLIFNSHLFKLNPRKNFQYFSLGMNPFTYSGKTQTAVSVNVINIRSLSTTVAGASFKKLTRILDLKCEINIIIDSRTSLQGVNGLFNSHNLKWRLGNFRHKGSYSNVKGIVMVYDRTRVQVDNLNIIKEEQLLSFRVTP